MTASPSGRDFHHPYKPYNIQNDLMNAIYDTIEAGQVGIFESPTGTGKSLSLICSATTWLRNHQEETALSVSNETIDEHEPAWVNEQAAKNKRAEVIQQHLALEARLDLLRDQLSGKDKRGHGDLQSAKRSKRPKAATSKPIEKIDIHQFELDDYQSDDGSGEGKQLMASDDRGLSSSSMKMMEELGLKSKADEDEELVPMDETKIFYCSRTHSQLQQFVHELRRVKTLAPWWSSAPEVARAASNKDVPKLKHMTLGSRKNLCIHPKVARLASTTAINEKCLELQQSKTSDEEKCPYLPKKGDGSGLVEFRDNTMANVHDIEDIAGLGRQLGVCPYYASRASAEYSEIITMPYPLLLQGSARDALGLSLKGHVVVIDEAHNLMDTISNIQSSSISLGQLKKCRSSLGIYLQKFRQRLKGKNRVYIAQLVRLIDSLTQYCEDTASKQTKTDGIVQPQELLKGKGLDQINLNSLLAYLEQSKLARKVEGYVQYEAEAVKQQSQSKSATDKTTPTLRDVQSFLQVLNNPAEEGCFFFERTESQDVMLKYMLLDPTWHFKEVVEQARSIILLGGTMSPMEDYSQYLFPYLPFERLNTWSCGHIIPKENLLAFPVTKNDDGQPFKFTYEKRNTVPLVESLGKAIVRLVQSIPDGVVVFFPSYAYLEKVISIWKKVESTRTETGSIFHQLETIKPVFQESKASGVDEVLTSYSASIDHSKGGILLAVVGGKLSEGINFSDALGRGVIIVGLPFPNAQSAQWKAKMEYIEKSVAKRTGNTQMGKDASRNFYENACMRAVNQSIGRAIRHREDYASIILLDRRYSSDRIQTKLPAWIRQGMTDQEQDLGNLAANLRSFFAKKQLQ